MIPLLLSFPFFYRDEYLSATSILYGKRDVTRSYILTPIEDSYTVILV